MHVSHDPNNHQEHVFTLAKNNNLQLKKMAAQSQLIPLGGLLRNTALDELPQVFNVLLGEMSLVGPRPDVLHPDEYDEEDKLRFDVLPGLTGLWQVSGKNRTTFAEMIQLDSAYVKQRSLWLDSKIVVLTVPAICRQIADERVARRKAG